MPPIFPGIADAVGLGGIAARDAGGWAAGGLPGAAVGGAWGAVAGWGAQVRGGGIGGAPQGNNAYAMGQAAFDTGQMPALPGPVPVPVALPPRPRQRRQAARPKRAQVVANPNANLNNAQAGPANH
jgi:hypothetical protein